MHAKPETGWFMTALGLVILALALFTSPTSGQQEILGDPVRGGQLYVAWDVVIGLERSPVTMHPLWPQNAVEASTRRTWRCVNCHGWDYRGAEGLTLASVVKNSDYPSLYRFTGESQDNIIAWLNGENDPRHDFSALLSETDLLDLSVFLSTSLLAPELIADLKSRTVQGTVEVGSALYQEWCYDCHGAEGERVNFGSAKTPIFMGDLAWQNPWRIAHVVRFGHILINMPPAEQAGISFSQQIDLLAYSQTLPRATKISVPELREVDYLSQASTVPLLIAALMLGLVVFGAVFWDQRRKKAVS